jgi:hypothetical protein
MKVIAKLEITVNRPEEMRVIQDSGFFLVQTLSNTGKWITQKEHKQEAAALMDCLTWY